MSTQEKQRQEKQIKVTDRRIFTPDGDLREEFKDLDGAAPPSTSPDPRPDPPPGPSAESASGPAPGRSDSPLAMPGGAAPAAPEADEADEPMASGAVFEDLVALLGQTASVYLRQAAQQLENRGEHLEMARMHIDLLIILEKKTRGRLAAREKAMLDDAIYQLRMAFVEVGG